MKRKFNYIMVASLKNLDKRTYEWQSAIWDGEKWKL